MTVEANTDQSVNIAIRNWNRKSGRQREAGEWTDLSPSMRQVRDDDIVFPPISPPPIWPRVFPSL